MKGILKYTIKYKKIIKDLKISIQQGIYSPNFLQIIPQSSRSNIKMLTLPRDQCSETYEFISKISQSLSQKLDNSAPLILNEHMF